MIKFRNIKYRLIVICLFLVTVPTIILGVISYNISKKNAYKNLKGNLGLIANGWKITTESYIEQVDRILKREDSLVEQRLSSIVIDTEKMFEVVEEYILKYASGNLEQHLAYIYGEMAEIKIGRSGYIFALGRNDDYLVSKNRENDGKNFYSFVDPNQVDLLKEKIELVKQSHDESCLCVHYKSNIGNKDVYRKVVSAFKYYKPLDIIIGACSYYTDFKSYDLLAKLQNELKYKIARQKIGKNGYTFAINSKGDYIVSKDRLRDGENILNERYGPDGIPLRSIIDEVKQKDRKKDVVCYYYWRDIGEESPSEKIAVLTYVSQWDWIIGASAYNDDFITGLNVIKLNIVWICLSFIVIGSMVAYFFALLIAKPIQELKVISLKATEGDLSIRVSSKLKKRKDEIGVLACTFDSMIENLNLRITDLNENKKRFSEVAANANEWLWDVDVNGLYTYSSPVSEKVIGYKPEEIVGEKYFFDFFINGSRERFKSEAFKTFEEKQSFKEFENCLKHKDGSEVWVSTNGVPILDEKGQMKGYRGSDTVITERKQAEQSMKKLNYELENTVAKLKSANEELKSFAFIASHDLREPLRKIVSFGGILKDSLSDTLSEDDKENFDFMIDGADRMTKMIEGLMIYSRVSTRSLPAETVDLNKIVEEIKGFELSFLFEESHAELEVPEPLPLVEIDPVQVRQLFQNLISNAIKYQEKGKTARIIISSTPAANGMVKIKVADNGIGIKPEFHQLVFAMFRRLHSRSDYEGTGIGLSVCKRIVEHFGGTIDVESQPGEGSTFWFTLPQAKVTNIVMQQG